MRAELSQTISSLLGSIGMEKGCRRCDSGQSIENEDQLFLLEEEDILEDLMTPLKSEYFRVLRGAITLLREAYERMLLTVFRLAGMDGI